MHVDLLTKTRLLLVVLVGGGLLAAPWAKGDWSIRSRFRFHHLSDFADYLHSDLLRTIPPTAWYALDSGDGNNHGADSESLRDEAIADSTGASEFISSMAWPPHDLLPSINLENRDLTITGSGQTTLNLRNFIIKGGTLTLQGTAGTDFIINVRNTFRLSDSAKVVLSGGLQPWDVHFDVIGTGWPAVIRQHSILTGFIQATHRMVLVIGHSDVFGYVTASKVKLIRDGKITPPPSVSP
jgi:hypothetical protein